MQITIRNYRAVRRADIDLSGVVLVAGPNEAGKTSIAQAAAALLTGVSMPLPGGKKKDAAELVTDGADAGLLKLTAGEATRTLMLPTCLFADGDFRLASEIAVGRVSLVDLKPDERAAVLVRDRYIDAAPTREDLAAAMADIEATPEQIEGVWQAIGEKGWDVQHAAVKEAVTKAKGAWEQITGEAWGQKKAAGWMPEGCDKDLIARPAEDLAVEEAAALADVDRAVANGALSVQEAAALRLAADEGKAVDLAEATRDVEDAKRVHEGLIVKRNALPTTEGQETHPCPHCGGAVAIVFHHNKNAPAHLKIPTADHVTEAEARKRALDRAAIDGQIERATTMVKTAERALVAAEAKVAAGLRAAAQIAELDSAADEDAAGAAIDAARQRLAEAQRRSKAYGTYHAAIKKFRAVAKNNQLADILAPEGLRKTALARGLGAFNDRLAAICEAARFPVFQVGPDMEISRAGVPVRLLSLSAQWRTRVMLQIAMAEIDGSAAVVIDAADILDPRGRNGLFAMLAAVKVPVLVTMTFGKPTASVPDLAAAGIGRTYWLADGTLTPLADAMKVAA